MIVPKDLYTFTYHGQLGSFGSQIVQYSIRQYKDVRNLGITNGYILTCRQRIIIPNANVYQLGPASNNGYINYPAAVSNSIAMTANNGADIQLRSIFPVTLNASINTSQSSQSGSTSSTSNQVSSGSNQSQTNTFGVSLSAGFFGEVPMGGVALDYQHSWESGSFQSSAAGSEAGQQASASSSESMSVKDWSSFGYTDPTNKTPTWIWGQSYPWDVIQYNQSTNGTTINLPSFVQSLLLNGNLLMPPSQLSQFGLDFTMKAGWLIEFPNGVTTSETVNMAHTTKLFLASHRLVAGTPPTVSASLQTGNNAAQANFSSGQLDLSTYALDPIWSPSTKNGAAIGFTVDRFTYAPTSSNPTFKILSAANNLQVEGVGFEPPTATNPPTAPPYLNCQPAVNGNATSVMVQFKLLDTTKEYFLHIMHWIGANSDACVLLVEVNGTRLNPFYVDSVQGQGGQNNMTSIELRNLDYQAPNYHDYLVLGLNTIKIIINATTSNTSNLYTLYAMAVGQG